MAHWLFLPDDVMSDLETLASLPPEKIDTLRHLLDSSEYQPKRKSFVKVAEALGISDESAAKLCIFLDYVQRQRASNKEEGVAVLSELTSFVRSASEDRETRDAASRIAAFLEANRDRLGMLFSELPSYVHFDKVRDLESGPLPHLGSFRAYCDLRPVYDADADEILGCFPVITLSMLTHCVESGEMREVLVQMTEADLAEFRKQFKRLDKKLAKLKARFPDLTPAPKRRADQ
jgi:hypothetical protein